jgi:DNA-binding transcriptional regulator LsrR (DeoR family)
MARPKNTSKAKRAITRMPLGSWVDVRAIARDARLSTYVITNFLVKARREGIVDKKIISHGTGKLHLWRRIA